MESGKLRLAVLGAGDVAQRDYLPEMHRLADEVQVVAICSRTGERARSVAEQYRIPEWYTDYEEMLAAGGFDAVANLTPIQLHAETTLACIQAGKHVYTEKPAATTVHDAARIRDEAAQRGLTLVCAPCVLLFPQVRRAHSLLAADGVGRIHLARGRGYGGVPPWRGYTSDPSPFFVPGGGPAMDMGVYPLHAITGLIGHALRVTAMSARTQQSFVVEDGPAAGKEVPVEVDDNWQILLDLGDGRLATVDANNCAQGTQAPELELLGLRGTIALDVLDVAAPVSVLQAGSGWRDVSVDNTGRASGPDHVLGIQHLAQCVRTGKKPVLSIEHAIHVLEIIELAGRAAETGCAQELTTTFQPPVDY